MDNASLLNDACDNITTPSSNTADLALYLANIRDLALKVIYVIIGSVGVTDNLFVIIVFFLFIKIKDKVGLLLAELPCSYGGISTKK